MNKHRPGTRLTRQQIEDVKERLGRGQSPSQIAPDTGIGRSSVYEIRRDLVPRLCFGSAKVELFTDAVRWARYATVEVVNPSQVQAAGCVAWVQVANPAKRLPLHWAGEPYTPHESGAPAITIYPEKPARLDMAFALPPPGPDPRRETLREVASGQIARVAVRIGPAPSVPFDTVSQPRWDGRGCWLAQPLALYNPMVELEAYMPPGEYAIKVTVRWLGNALINQEFILTSPDFWAGLDLTPVSEGRSCPKEASQQASH